ncbi:hypothetical protein F5884DRAFT_241855 [Xylogone sp. PMI_703]|nr:hypothetical protein F5884DRAFT_241855 [Xylogone sp. PMI_703]
MKSTIRKDSFCAMEPPVSVDVDRTFSDISLEPGSSLHLMKLDKDLDTHIENLPIPLETNICDPTELKTIRNAPDSCQIFCIKQRNSYSRLQITRELFTQLLESYWVFPRFWEYTRSFGFKTKENDLINAPFEFRQRQSAIKPDNELKSFECAYGFRFVEMNNRVSVGVDNPDYDPWSVRQSAIYQQYDSQHDRIMFILISPSRSVQEALRLALSNAATFSYKQPNAFDLHRTIISTLYENWRLYIGSLESLIRHQTEHITLAQVQDEGVKLSPLRDFAINFVDRQRLKMIEDKVLDLTIIFESLHNTLTELRRQCQMHCRGDICPHCNCPVVIGKLEEQIRETEVNLKRVEVLYRRCQSTAQLLSDLLNYENAHIAQANEKILNDLMKEAKEENSKMRILTEKSTKDAAAVKILTTITLIYLPTTVVASFFSSQLIRVSETGQVSLVSASWWFAVISVPLTVLTVLVWKWWLSRLITTQRQTIRTSEVSDQQTSKCWVSICGNTCIGVGRYILRRKSRSSRDTMSEP